MDEGELLLSKLKNNRGCVERTIAGTFGEAITAMVEHVLEDMDRAKPHVLVGPVVWQPGEGGARRWYFVIGSGGADGFRSDQLAGADEALTDQMRAAVYATLLRRPPIVLHEFDDECEMARWAELIWPSDKTRGIRTAMEAERRAGVRPPP